MNDTVKYFPGTGPAHEEAPFIPNAHTVEEVEELLKAVKDGECQTLVALRMDESGTTRSILSISDKTSLSSVLGMLHAVETFLTLRLMHDMEEQ